MPALLNAHDLSTDCWRKVKEYLTERVADMRTENDADLDATTTAKKRGRIAEALDTLSLGYPQDAPVVPRQEESEGA